jgi:DNA polymerase I
MKLIPLGEPARQAIERYGNKTPERLRGDVFSLDTETTGLSPHLGGRIFCYSIFSNKGEKLWLPKTPRTTQFVMDLLNDPEKVVIFQNAKYDLLMSTFEDWSIDDLKSELHDTLAMSILVDEYGSHDLGSLVRRWLGVSVDTKGSVDAWLKANQRAFNAENGRSPNYSDVPTEIMQLYSEWDAEQTLKLGYYLKTPIKQHFWELYQTELELIKCTIEMELRGLLVDLNRARELRAKAVADIAWIEDQMRRVIGRDFILKGTGVKKEMIKVITEDLGWPIGRTTPKGNPQFDEYAMLCYLDPRLAHIVREKADSTPAREYINLFEDEVRRIKADRGQTFVPLKLKWRELDKMVTTYYDALLEKSVPWKNRKDLGVLHPKWNSLTAITGRFSSSEPNLQNIPRILGPRQCFRARPGFTNYHFDYSQVELRLYIHYAKDEKLKQLLLAGKDLHLETAVDIFEKSAAEITKEERKRAKQTNFGVLYGSGPETLAETLTKMGIPTSEAQAVTILGKFHQKRPSMRRLMGQMKGELMRRGYVEDEFGRRFRVPLKLSYKAINARIQGCSADIMKRAMVRIYRLLKRGGYRSQLIKTIHDEIVVEVHHSEEAELVPKLKAIMEKDSHMFWVPITCDIERTTKYWSDKHDKTDECAQKNCKKCPGEWHVGELAVDCGCKCHTAVKK